jgi:hypothetical protein
MKAPPYSKTTVHVVKDDCVVAYEQIMKKKETTTSFQYG